MSAGDTRRRPGRPAGSSGTREAILASARELFARNGIGKTSIRAIAADAAVDSALIYHYFGTKQRLFAAVVNVPIDPDEILAALRESPVGELGHAIPAVILPLWDSEMGVGLKAALRSALAGDQIGMFTYFLRDVVLKEIAARLDDPAGSGLIRAGFVASQILGVVMARHIFGLEPFASLPVDRIVETIAPSLQRYLTGQISDIS